MQDNTALIAEKITLATTPLLYSIRNAAKLCDVSPDLLYKYARDGILPTVSFGNRVLVRHADLVAFVDSNARPAGMPPAPPPPAPPPPPPPGKRRPGRPRKPPVG